MKLFSCLLTILLITSDLAYANPLIIDPLPPTAEAEKDAATLKGQAVKALLPAIKDIKKNQNNTGLSEAAADSNSVSTAGMIFKMVQALGICIGVFLIGVHIFKRYKRTPQKSISRHIRIIERSALTAKTDLVLAQVEGQKVLLSVGSDRVSALDFGHPLQLAQDLVDSESEGLQEEELCNGIKLSA